MAFLALIIGAIFVIAAIRDTQGELFAALGTDVPEYVVWAAAIVAIGAIGFIKPISPVSRALLFLILLVLFLNNYQAILTGFQNVVTSTETGSGSGTGGNAKRGSVTVSGLTGLQSTLASGIGLVA